MLELGESAELTNELIMEAAKEDEAKQERSAWHTLVALSTLLMALFTAIGALLAGITAHEALLDRTKEVIEVSILEGDRVCVEVLKAKHEMLISLEETPNESEIDRIQAYEEAVAELEKEAARDEARLQSVASPHLVFAVAVTLLAVGISLSGMSIIVEEKFLWFAGMAFGVVGSIGIGIGIVTMLFLRSQQG